MYNCIFPEEFRLAELTSDGRGVSARPSLFGHVVCWLVRLAVSSKTMKQPFPLRYGVLLFPSSLNFEQGFGERFPDRLFSPFCELSVSHQNVGFSERKCSCTLLLLLLLLLCLCCKMMSGVAVKCQQCLHSEHHGYLL